MTRLLQVENEKDIAVDLDEVIVCTHYSVRCTKVVRSNPGGNWLALSNTIANFVIPYF